MRFWAILLILISTLDASVSANDAAPGSTTTAPDSGTTANPASGTQVAPPPVDLVAPPAKSASLPSKGSNLEWSDSSEYETCGPACIYKNAAKDIALATTDQWQVASELKRLNMSDKADREKAERLMGSFYVKGKLDDKDDQKDIERARDAYLLMATNVLRNLRNAEMMNRSKSAKLASRASKANGELGDDLGVAPFSKNREDLKKPQVPMIMSFPQLETEYKEMRKSGKILDFNSAEYKAFKQMILSRPELRQSDFPMFKEIPRDPKKPNGEKFVVAVQEYGKNKLDPVSFAEAKKDYDNKQRLDDLKTLMDEFESGSKVAIQNRENTQDLTNLKSGRKERIEQFNRARVMMVDKVNETLVKSGLTTTATFPSREKESGRKPSSASGKLETKDANKAAPKTPTGDESVNAVKATEENQGKAVDVGWDPKNLEELINDLIP